MKQYYWLPVLLLALAGCHPRIAGTLSKKDLHKDIEMVTTAGTLVIRLYDATPLHRDNFIKLVQQHFYDSILFHRVIKNFMVQAGDPNTRRAIPGRPMGSGGPGYTIPAEFRPTLFHKKGVIAAARENDEANPQKASSGSQFYLVQGKVFTDAGLDSVETFRLRGKKIPPAQRAVYKTLGGAPHLDQNYTVFGEVIKGIEVIDSLAGMPTTGHAGGDRPLQELRIIKLTLVKRTHG
jgi:peptidyl-prolyl cis-trans isomerase B (cyclophilin B)